jgi:hypothetical protein
VAPDGIAGLGLPVHPSPAANDPLDVLGRAALGHRQQPLLRFRSRDAGHRAYLGVRDIGAGERLGQPRKVPQRACHPHVLAGRTDVESYTPAQPVRARAEPGVPPLAHVELTNEVEQARRRRLEVRRQLGDLVAETVELRDGRRGGQHVKRVNLHGRVLPVLERLYTAFSEPSG